MDECYGDDDDDDDEINYISIIFEKKRGAGMR